MAGAREGAVAAAAEAGEKARMLVAVDDSEESFYALEWALDHLFGDYGDDESKLTVIHVMEPFPHYVFPGFQAVFPTTSIIQSVNKAQREEALTILARASSICTQRMVKSKSIVVEGDPKEMICDTAEQMNIDLIVMGNRGLGKIKRAFLGSVGDYVIHHAKCPVLIVKLHTRPGS